VILERTRHTDTYRAIRDLSSSHEDYSISELCKHGHVTRSAYYKWLHRKSSPNDDLNHKLAALAEEIHKEHPDMGYRRLRDKIEHDHRLHANDKRILRICRKRKLRSVIKGRHNCCTKPAVDPYYTAENLLNRDFHADSYNQKWATDVTEFKYTAEDGTVKKLYLSAILDLCDRRPVSYVIGDNNNNQLVFQTLDRALEANPSAQPLFHSDRGFQYTNKNFRTKIEQAGMTQSMSRVAHCLDNGPMEGFWGILKREMYYRRKFRSRQELVQAIEDYINYYTYERPQRRLGILTPSEFHEHLSLMA
jgi:transposase InsO family protein